MEARFVILHSLDPYEILISSELIRALVQQVEESVVCSVIRSDLSWLIDEPSLPHEVLTYAQKPSQAIPDIHDFVPDYLLDLQGGWQSWFFRNRLKVIDFILKRRSIQPGHSDQYRQQIYKLVTLFDVEQTEQGHDLFNNQYSHEWLPDAFQDGYLMLYLDPPSHKTSIDSWIEFLGLLETPVVLFGTVESRSMADTLGQKVGCTLFDACGDFTPADYFAMVHHSNGIMAGGNLWPAVGKWVGKKVLNIGDEKENTHGWIDTVRAWRPIT